MRQWRTFVARAWEFDADFRRFVATLIDRGFEVLVIALLTRPAAVAGYFARQLRQMMVLATILSVVVTTTGLLVSCAPDLPAEATTIVPAGAA